MDYTDLVGALERETDDYVEALGSGPLTAEVTSCPGWQLRELTHHVGDFTVFWTHLVCDALGIDQTPFPAMPDGDAGVVDWYDGLRRSLISVLSRAEPGTEVWTWHESDKSAQFVARRCAHELAIHRVDAQLARDDQQAVEGPLAVDGIDEILDPLLALAEPSGLATGQTMHLHATDRDGEWFITMNADGMVWTHEHAKGDLAIQAGASDLEMLLYQRPTLDDIARFGDETVLDVFHREFTFGPSD